MAPQVIGHVIEPNSSSRLTALSYWTYLFGGLFLYASFFVGAVPDGGWFAYVPLTGPRYSPGLALDFWDIGLSVAEVAALGAAAELIVGILRMRAPGMRLDRLPLFAWAMLATAIMIVFAFTPLIVGTAIRGAHPETRSRPPRAGARAGRLEIPLAGRRRESSGSALEPRLSLRKNDGGRSRFRSCGLSLVRAAVEREISVAYGLAATACCQIQTDRPSAVRIESRIFW